jgi:CheY-like chemotaxis protein
MSPALRLRRLDAILALLSRAVASGGRRLDDALDALLDAIPALFAVAFSAEQGPEPVCERRIDGASGTKPGSLRHALFRLASTASSTGEARLWDLRHDPGVTDDARALVASGARAAIAVPLTARGGSEAALVLVFADVAMLDEETLRYIASVARVTELALATDLQGETERALRDDLVRSCDKLREQHDDFARALGRLRSIADPDDVELSRSLGELGEHAGAIGNSIEQLPVGEHNSRTAGRPSSGRYKVLLIDDDPVFSRALRRSLAPHEVRTAETASEAEIALLDEGYEPDLVVCDVSLPGVNGNVLHARIAARRPRIASRFVFVTGGALADEEVRYLRASGCRTLYKPLDAENLAALFAR